MIKSLKQIALIVVAVLTTQAVNGMSGGGEWEFMPLGTPEQIPLPHLEEQRIEGEDTYQILLARAQTEPNPIVREMLRKFAEQLKREYQQTTASSSSSSSHTPLGSKRKREDALDKGKESDEEESQQPPQVKTPKRERKELSHQESEQVERTLIAQRIQLTSQQVQELLKNQMTIPVDRFTEENLKALQGLDRVGTLIISSPVPETSIPSNLIGLIEQYFPNILALYLRDLNLGDAGFTALAKSAIASQLINLYIAQYNTTTYITPLGFTTENLNKFNNLERLMLYNNDPYDAGFEALAKSTIASRLKTLIVSGCGITHLGFTTENLNKFSNLEYLDISHNHLEDVEFEILAKSTIAAQLKKLVASTCNITDLGFTTENLNKFSNLEYLDISHNPLEDVEFEALTESTIAPRLKTLILLECGITTQGFTTKNLNRFKNLEYLNISHNQLGDAGFEALAESTIAPRLKTLVASKCGITDQGFTGENLKKFKSLKELNITGNQLSKDGLLGAVMHSHVCETMPRIVVNRELDITEEMKACSILNVR